MEEAQRLLKDMGLEDSPEIADVKQLDKAGLLSEANKQAIERADEEAAKYDGWATAYDTLQTCVLRFAQ